MADKRNKELVKVIEANSSDWIEQVPAVLGDASGVVDAGGSLVNCRLSNGYPVVAINYVAPLIFDLQVLIGRNKSQPNYFQVISVRETYTTPVSNSVKYHHEQHEEFGGDRTNIGRRQIIPRTLWVKDAANFIMQFYPDVAQTQNGIAYITTGDPDEEINLSGYVPSTGGKYVTIACDEDGLVSVIDGDEVESPQLLTTADIPVPAVGSVYLGHVLLYETQAELSDENIHVALALGGFRPTAEQQIHDADEETSLNDDDEIGFWNSVTELLGKITKANFVIQLTTLFDTLYAAIVHTHTASDIGIIEGHEHSLMRWNGASSQTTFDLPEYWAYVEQVFVNGVCQDPLDYSLSGTGDQIIFDTGLPTDMTVVANGVIAQV